MKLGWLTDPHLDFAHPPARRALAEELWNCSPDGLVVTGDIGEAPTVLEYLEWLAEMAKCPVYFVLGNHDFYRSSIGKVREMVRAHCETASGLFYLTGASAITLTDRVALVGHDGWGDARVGRVMETPVRLRDFDQIEELKGLEQMKLVERLGALGREAAQTLEKSLGEALEWHDHVLVASHVPPTEESAWHEGQGSNGDWSPYFVCGAMGEMLQRMAQEHPKRRITVLCGHTHSAGEVWLQPNLSVRTGKAVYGEPRLQPPLLILPTASW